MKNILTIWLLLVCLCIPKYVTAIENDFNKEEKEFLWGYIKRRLLNDDGSVSRYQKDIRISLKDGFKESDSLVVLRIIERIKECIKDVDVLLVEKDGNLDVSVCYTDTIDSSVDKSITIGEEGEIEYQNIKINLNRNIDYSKFCQVLQFYIIRSLLNIERFPYPYGARDLGPIILHSNVASSSFISKGDRYILSEIYSSDFEQNLKANFPGGVFEYMICKYGESFKLLREFVYVLAAVLILIIFLFFGVFEREAKTYFTFLLQGVAVSSTIWSYFFASEFLLRDIAGDFPESIESKLETIGAIVFFSLLFIHLCYIIERVLFKFLKGIIARLALVFLSSFIGGYIAIVSFYLIFNGFLPKITHYAYGDVAIFIQLIGLGMLRVIYVFLNINKHQAIRLKDIEVANLEKLKQQAELQALHSRINPHFLYNSLNSIASLAHLDADKTEQMALSLSDFCRSAINKQNKDIATVEEEIEMIRNYLEIEKVRFGDRLAYRIVVDERLKALEIPRFILQPLVENAIKHGVSKITGQGMIEVSLVHEGDLLLIKVADNGPAFPDELISGYGLQSLNDKLAILYNEAAQLKWQNEPQKYIAISLPLKSEIINHEQ